ncbi:MAG TPA: HupE/UreJ family protein, partial [Burkholderiales bacterium]|nr:HupE/UreJ family protein [Burkholderiales bacterium]
MTRIALLLLLTLCAANVYAHKPSDSYLSVSVDGDKLRGQWDIALRDLDFAIGLDSNGDGDITWGEVRSRHNDIAAYALARLTATLDGVACPLKVSQHMVDLHSDGTYTVMRFEGDCVKPGATLELGYNLFFDLDPQHKGLLRLQYAGTTRTAIFSPDTARQRFELTQASRLMQFIDYGREG